MTKSQKTGMRTFFVHEKPNPNHFRPSYGRPIDCCRAKTEKEALIWFCGKYGDGSQGDGDYVLTYKDMSI